MSAVVRRIIIIVLLAVLVGLWVYKTRDGDPADGQGNNDLTNSSQTSNPAPALSEEELKKLLEETVIKKWEAQMNNRWEVVYEMQPTDFKKAVTLVSFMQGKDQFYYENWKLVDMQIEGHRAVISFTFDWGVHLRMDLDMGEAKKRGVGAKEVYLYDPETRTWGLSQEQVK
jgi:hypothetical protein